MSRSKTDCPVQPIPDPRGMAGHELAMNLRSAYLAMHRATNACFAESGLSADSFTLLSTLVECGSMTQKELAHRVGSDANTISAMVVRLERCKWVERKRDMRDGRVRIVQLTDEGRQLQAQLWVKSQSLRLEMVQLFHPVELNNLVLFLKRITQTLGDTSN